MSMGVFIRLGVYSYRAVWYPIYRGMRDRGARVPACRFEPTCSEYAIRASRLYPWHVAMRKICGRLLRCRRGGGGGVDYP